MPLPPTPPPPVTPIPHQTGTSWAVPPIPAKEGSGRRSGLLGRERSKETQETKENKEIARLRTWIEQTQGLDAIRLADHLAKVESEAAALLERAKADAHTSRENAEADAQTRRESAKAHAEAIRRTAIDSAAVHVASAKEVDRAAERVRADLKQHQGELLVLQAQLAQLRGELAVTEEAVMLQQVGIYAYQHPLQDSIAYRTQLDSLQADIKRLASSGRAVLSVSSWVVNGSAVEGKKMVRDFSKLMLRAYNSEADQAVRTMRPHRLQPLVDRLYKTRETIAKLGATMQIRISDEYHNARVRELHLTADYLQKKEEEKEAQREARARQREEEAAQREFERERAKLEKERRHVESVLARLRDGGEGADVEKFEAKIAELDEAMRSVEARAANIRTGYVYVISNVGAFGDRIVKIGLTRRLDPTDRIYELSGASVPFRFDIHALIFSDDAVSLETKLHQHFADRRVNRVNTRREFFYVTPTEVREALQKFAGQQLVEFTDEPEALEWRASQAGQADS